MLELENVLSSKLSKTQKEEHFYSFLICRSKLLFAKRVGLEGSLWTFSVEADPDLFFTGVWVLMGFRTLSP